MIISLVTLNPDLTEICQYYKHSLGMLTASVYYVHQMPSVVQVFIFNKNIVHLLNVLSIFHSVVYEASGTVVCSAAGRSLA